MLWAYSADPVVPLAQVREHRERVARSEQRRSAQDMWAIADLVWPYRISQIRYDEPRKSEASRADRACEILCPAG